MKPFNIRPEAVDELDDAATWYEEASQGLGSAFLRAYESRLRLALETPTAGTIVGHTAKGQPIRRYRLPRFRRYAILMALIDEVPTVLALSCSSRHPSQWMDRCPDTNDE